MVSSVMPYPKRRYSPGQLQFITTSTYRRAPLFDSDRFRRCFVETLAGVRRETNFLLIGWVLMPDHFHLLLKPEPAEATSRIVKRLKEKTATRILKLLRENQQYPWCRKMLARLRLPRSVHDDSHYRVWQRRFYPFNVYSEKKRLEKLDYMHNNAMKRGLVPGISICSSLATCHCSLWPWSSWRFYFLQDTSILEMDCRG